VVYLFVVCGNLTIQHIHVNRYFYFLWKSRFNWK